MKMTKLPLLLLATLLPRFASADLVGPYTVDTNTVVLLHFDEPAGTTTVTNPGTFGRNFLSTTINASGAAPVDLLGGTGYSTNLPAAISFGGCMTNGIVNNSLGFGCDYNGDGLFTNNTTFSDFVPMSALNMGKGTNTPWTIEALLQPSISPLTTAFSHIFSAESSVNSPATRRAFQYRIGVSAGVYTMSFIAVNVPGGGSLVSNGTIPSSGPNAVVSNAWYHMAATYDGTNVTLYWTRLDPANGAANVLSVTPQNLGAGWGGNSSPLIIGNYGRGGNGAFPGCIDEVRISKVCRAANQMQFFSPAVTIVQNPPALQNVDYNQPVSFFVGASSLTPLSYQWRFNSNVIAGATSPTYTIPNVASFDAGYYDCVVTNTAGYSNQTTVARLVVGAASFLSHRYSFNSNYVDATSGLVCTPDSIGGANGTNYGNATISGGQLVLDGSSGTYMQMPGGLFSASTATALTIEFWATFGTNPNNTWFYLFNNTYSSGSPVGFFGLLCNNASGLPESRGGRSSTVDQAVIASNSWNGLTRHVACTIDPPNKTIAIYTNGVLAAINTNAPVTIADVANITSFIGYLGTGSGPCLNASIDELRMYNGALSPITIKQSADQGPNVVLASGPVEFAIQPVGVAAPTGQTATFTAAAVGYLPISYQWFKNSTPVSGATNAAWSFPAVLGDNGASIYCQASNTIGVTSYVTNSSTVTLTVFTPPTLAWLDAANGGADSFWNTTSLNWTNNAGSIVVFAQTNGVVFDARGSGAPSVDIAEAITPYNITANASTDYTLLSSGANGSLNGPGGITKQNTGRLIIGVSNNLSGLVLVSGGTLQVGDGGANGSLGTSVVTNNATLSVNRSDTELNVSNPIRGSGTVSFDGTGTVTVSGASDYTSSTLLNSGIVQLTSPTGLGATTSGTTVANGAQLYLTANVNLAEPLTLNGAGDGNGALRKGTAGAATQSGPVFLASDATIGVNSGSTLNVSNLVSGSAALTASGSGTLTLNTNNSFSGGLTLNGPVVNLNAGGALGSGPVTIAGAGRLVIGGGLNITNALVANAISPGAGYGLLTVSDNTNGTITTVSGPLDFNASPANGGSFVGPISSGYLHVTGPITNTVTGTIVSRLGNVRFSGGGEYATLTLAQGTASLGANNGLSRSATVNLGASGASVFDLNGFNQALVGLEDGGANAKLVTNTAAGLSTLTLNIPGSGTYSGVIAGKLALVKNDIGIQLLAGTNTYVGNTTVNGGTLELANPSLASGSTVIVANGAQLQLDFADTNTVAGLVLSGVNQPGGVYSAALGTPLLAGIGSLLVVPVNTTPTNLVVSVSGTTLTLSWPSDHIGWRLLQQTNHLALGVSSNPNDWGTVSGSASTNQVNMTIDPAKPTVFYRLVYP